MGGPRQENFNIAKSVEGKQKRTGPQGATLNRFFHSPGVPILQVNSMELLIERPTPAFLNQAKPPLFEIGNHVTENLKTLKRPSFK